MRFMRGVGAERSRPVGGAALLAALLALAGCDDPKPAAAGAAPASPADGSFVAAVDFATLTAAPAANGAHCELTVQGALTFDGTLVGTAEGTTIAVDGYQVATALQEQGLRDLVAITGGTYAPASEATGVESMTDSLERRVTSVDETTEITALFALAAMALLVAGGGLMLRWFGRVV